MRCGTCKDPPQGEMKFCPYCGALFQEKNEIKIRLGPEETRISIEIVWDDREYDTAAAGERKNKAAAGEEKPDEGEKVNEVTNEKRRRKYHE